MEESRIERDAFSFTQPTNDPASLETTQPQLNIFHEEISGYDQMRDLVSKNVMLSSSLNSCEDDDKLQIATNTARLSSPDSQVISNPDMQSSEQVSGLMIDYNDNHCQSNFKELNNEFTPEDT